MFLEREKLIFSGLKLLLLASCAQYRGKRRDREVLGIELMMIKRFGAPVQEDRRKG